MGYSKNNLPETIQSTKQLKSLVDKARKKMDGWNYAGLPGAGNCTQLDGQCGMQILCDLEEVNSRQQALCLTDAFYGCGEDTKICAQVIISDVCKTKAGAPSNKWLATKKYAHTGPVSTNPNTGHYVRHYTITTRMLVDIYNHDAHVKAKKK